MENLPINDPVEIGEKYSSTFLGKPGFMEVYEKVSNQNRLNVESNTNQKIKNLSFKRDSIILVSIVIVAIIFLLTCEKHMTHLGVALLSVVFGSTSIVKTIVKTVKDRISGGD